MKEPIIIEELGKIFGRDAIYLDAIEFLNIRTVKLRGDINGALCENITRHRWIAYELTFHDLLEFSLVKIDFFQDTGYTSSFERIIESEKIKRYSMSSQGHKVKKAHEQYLFHTYDDVIAVIASGFEIKLTPKEDS